MYVSIWLYVHRDSEITRKSQAEKEEAKEREKERQRDKERKVIERGERERRGARTDTNNYKKPGRKGRGREKKTEESSDGKTERGGNFCMFMKREKSQTKGGRQKD